MFYVWDQQLGETVAGDELIAGARLQWSVTLGFPGGTISLAPGTTYNKRTDELRRLMQAAGLRQVQVTTSSFDATSWSFGKTYAGRFVVEMTTPINRARKADLLWDLGQMAIKAGLIVDPNPAHNNLALMSQGGVPGVSAPGALPPEPYAPPDPADKPKKTGIFEDLADSLGVSVGVLGMSAFVLVLIALRNR